MAILRQQDRQAVQKKFDLELKRDVNIKLFTQRDIGLFIPGRECKTCTPTQQLLEELNELSPRLNLEIIDFYSNSEQTKSLGIERIPATVLSVGDSENVRFYGMPSGIEFALLQDTLISISDKRSTLQLETRRRLKKLKEDVHIQVFVTPN